MRKMFKILFFIFLFFSVFAVFDFINDKKLKTDFESKLIFEKKL